MSTSESQDITPGYSLRLKDGKCWKHNGEYMGHILRFGTLEKGNKPAVPYYKFENGLVSGANLKFTEVECDKNGEVSGDNLKLYDGKCWKHYGEEMGHLQVINKQYDDTTWYGFENGSALGKDMKFFEIPCKQITYDGIPLERIEDKIPSTSLMLDDGKCWKHKGEYLGKYKGFRYIKGKNDKEDKEYTFENKILLGDNLKFTEIRCINPRAFNSTAFRGPPDTIPGQSVEVKNNKCWNHVGQYLGKFVSKTYGRDDLWTSKEGRLMPYEIYTFEKGSVQGINLHFTEVSCEQNKKGGTRKNKKSFRRSKRSTRVRPKAE